LGAGSLSSKTAFQPQVEAYTKQGEANKEELLPKEPQPEPVKVEQSYGSSLGRLSEKAALEQINRTYVKAGEGAFVEIDDVGREAAIASYYASRNSYEENRVQNQSQQTIQSDQTQQIQTNQAIDSSASVEPAKEATAEATTTSSSQKDDEYEM
jgi:hypothetical protein